MVIMEILKYSVIMCYNLQLKHFVDVRQGNNKAHNIPSFSLVREKCPRLFLLMVIMDMLYTHACKLHSSRML